MQKKEIMKNNLLLTLTLASIGLDVFSQLPVGTLPTNKKAVLEQFVGIVCGYSPDGDLKATQVFNANPGNVILIDIHSGSWANATTGQPDFKTPIGDAIYNMPGMGVPYIPAGAMNREVFVGTTMAN